MTFVQTVKVLFQTLVVEPLQSYGKINDQSCDNPALAQKQHNCLLTKQKTETKS
jgi:hypothetical protein